MQEALQLLVPEIVAVISTALAVRVAENSSVYWLPLLNAVCPCEPPPWPSVV